MKRIHQILICIIFLSIVEVPVHADGDWITVAQTDSGGGVTWQAEPGSLMFEETKNGTAVAVVTGRVINRTSSQITVEEWYVSASDCVHKQGTVVTLTVSGEYKYENDFVFGAGNVASNIAKIICMAAVEQASGEDLGADHD